MTLQEIEQNRVADLKDRLESLSDHNSAHYSLNPNVPNIKLWARKSIWENSDKVAAEANMVALEASDVIIATYEASVEYKGLRKAEYPSIVDQLDKIYHEGIDSWKAEIKIIKDKYPKS